MSGIEAKLRAAGIKYRKDSKQYNAARYIVRQNREITSEERKAIVQEIPIKYKTLQGVFTKLRETGLYPPQKTSDTPNRLLTPEKPQEAPQPPEVPQEILHQATPNPQLSSEYVTKEEFETLKNSINYLASVIGGENPVEDEKETSVEVNNPEEVIIVDPSLTRTSIYLKPKTQMYFDMARQGVFSNYAGTRDLSPFTQFNGNLSDFFNIIVDDYFIRNFNADIGLLMRRYA